MRHNVSTPGGFFVGLGGIVAFCVVSALVYLWVRNPAPNTELRQQQANLGLAAAPDADRDTKKQKEKETGALLEAAAVKYNGGDKPNIDNLAELRGVVRYREAQKAAQASEAVLTAASSAQGKTVIALAMEQTAQELAAKKPAPSKVAVAEPAPADPKALPALPNYSGGGVKTVVFANPNQPAPAAPAPGAAPAAPGAAPGAPQPPHLEKPAPAPANPAPAPQASAPIPAVAPVATNAPARRPLLNWSESQ